MKATLDLPDSLIQQLKLRAVHERAKLKDVAAEMIRRGLSQPEPLTKSAERGYVKLPLIECGHPATGAEQLTPDRLAQILIDQEVEWHLDASRR
ncbi:MAG TPA: hypothetical protein VM074_05810 [Solimonas sp.]|nr:hypothetical protein [Solimonas sp.]